MNYLLPFDISYKSLTNVLIAITPILNDESTPFFFFM